MLVAKGSTALNLTRPLVVEASHPRRETRVLTATKLGDSVPAADGSFDKCSQGGIWGFPKTGDPNIVP